MKKLLKDHILELQALGLDNETIAIQVNTSPGYVQYVINEVKKKQLYEETKKRDGEAAEDYLSVPSVAKIEKYVLLTNNPDVKAAEKAMLENKDTDLDPTEKTLLHSWIIDKGAVHKTDKKCTTCGVLRSLDENKVDVYFVDEEWIKEKPSCIEKKPKN
jgi:hypothetical protein